MTWNIPLIMTARLSTVIEILAETNDFFKISDESSSSSSEIIKSTRNLSNGSIVACHYFDEDSLADKK